MIGSSYTPREIVDYMVDESLKALALAAGETAALAVMQQYPTAIFLTDDGVTFCTIRT